MNAFEKRRIRTKSSAKARFGVNFNQTNATVSSARRIERKKEDEVDILVVGDVVLPEMAALIRAEESKRGKEIKTLEDFI